MLVSGHIILTQPHRLGEWEEETLGCRREKLFYHLLPWSLWLRVQLMFVQGCVLSAAPQNLPSPHRCCCWPPVPMGGIKLDVESPQAQHTALLGNRAAKSISPQLCCNPGTVAFSSPSVYHPTCRAGLEIPHAGTLCWPTYLGMKKLQANTHYSRGTLSERKGLPPDLAMHPFSDLAII